MRIDLKKSSNNNSNTENEDENESEKIDIITLNSEEGESGESIVSNSFFSCVSSIDDFDDFCTPSTTSATSNLSRVVSESGMSAKTTFVQLPIEEQIQRDPVTEEQLIRIRREIEELEKVESRNIHENNANNSSSKKDDYELSRRKSKNKKELVKVPLESGLPVALHPNETGKEVEESSIREDDERRENISGVRAVGDGVNFDDNDDAEEMISDIKSSSPTVGMEIVDEDHRNYILMYDMLTGIRTSVSKCQAKPPRPLTSRDYKSSQKMAFDLTGSEETPSSRYDFKFKDYAPWVFRSLREQFSIDAADYLVIQSQVKNPPNLNSLSVF